MSIADLNDIVHRNMSKLDNQDLALEEIRESISDLKHFICSTISQTIDDRKTTIDQSFPQILKFTVESVKNIESTLNELDSLTSKLTKENHEMTNKFNDLTNNHVCVFKTDFKKCVSTNILVYFCKNYDKSFPLCNLHLRRTRKKKTNLCTVCKKHSMVRRFAIPFPKKDLNLKTDSSKPCENFFISNQ